MDDSQLCARAQVFQTPNVLLLTPRGQLRDLTFRLVAEGLARAVSTRKREICCAETANCVT